MEENSIYKNYAKVSGSVYKLRMETIEKYFMNEVSFLYLIDFWVGNIHLFYQEEENIYLDLDEGDEVEVWFLKNKQHFKSKKGKDFAYKILAINDVNKHNLIKLSQGNRLKGKMSTIFPLCFVSALGILIVIEDLSQQAFVMIFGGAVLFATVMWFKFYFAYQSIKQFEQEYDEIMERYENKDIYINIDQEQE